MCLMLALTWDYSCRRSEGAHCCEAVWLTLARSSLPTGLSVALKCVYDSVTAL